MRKIIPAIFAGTTALAVAGGVFGYAVVHKEVTLTVDGSDSTLSTFAPTVGDALADKGIEVGDRDVVAPALDSRLSEGTKISVQYGREVTISVDGEEKTYWTTATRVDDALAALSIDTAGAELSASRSSTIGRAGIDLSIDTPKKASIIVAGKKKAIKTTARTVGEALKELDITMDEDDLLVADLVMKKEGAKKKAAAKKLVAALKKATATKASAKLTNGAEFTYIKVDSKVVAETEDIDFETIWKNTRELEKGKTKTEVAGKVGERTLKFAELRYDGLVVKSKEKSSKVTREPVNKVVQVGTKELARPNNNTSTKSDKTNAPSVASGSVWDRLAQCEAGGNWSINTGNGFYGGLQFTLSTWRAYGGSGMPHHASREEQIRIGQKVQAGQGWGAWPACTSKLGLR